MCPRYAAELLARANTSPPLKSLFMPPSTTTIVWGSSVAWHRAQVMPTTN